MHPFRFFWVPHMLCKQIVLFVFSLSGSMSLVEGADLCVKRRARADLGKEERFLKYLKVERMHYKIKIK